MHKQEERDFKLIPLVPLETEIQAETAEALAGYVGEFLQSVGGRLRFIRFPPAKNGLHRAKVGYYIRG